MTNEEFSNSFDVLLNSYATTASFGEDISRAEVVCNEYEKSVYLTKAQETLILSLYNGHNSSQESFEETEELRRYLASLVEEAKLSPITTSDGKYLGIESRSRFFTLPSDLWFITYESVSTTGTGCAKKDVMQVIPVRQDEYHVIKDNPFRGANSRRALRLDLSDGVIEIISTLNISTYYVRYLKKLTPIVLIDLPEELTIDGEGKETPCQLHEALHKKILDLAVGLAITSKAPQQKPQ